jgi:hypothetical protein
MAHYAYINDENIVVEVITGRDEDDLAEGVTSWEEYYGAVRGLRCLQTSYNTRGGVHYETETGEPSTNQSKAFRGNYAGIGFTYDEALDAFISPKPSEDATLDEDTFSWVVPEVEETDEA